MIICGDKFNILMLGGAKRVSMGRMFIDAAHRLGRSCSLFSYELDCHVPVASIGKVIKGKRWSDPQLMEHLHRTVVENEINVMVPFVDDAVEVAAAYRHRYNDVWAPVGDESVAAAMFDKIEADKLFRKFGVPLPDADTMRGRPVFPMIAKPRRGSASKGIEIITSPREYHKYTAQPPTHLLQRYIADREEYTVDCYVSQAGEIKVVSPRRRLDVSGGEVTSTVTVDIPALVGLSCSVIEGVGLRGAVTVQFLRDMEKGGFYLMEVNPRLGGGAVCSVHAGADIPLLMLSESIGVDMPPIEDVKAGTLITRYPQEVVFYEK